MKHIISIVTIILATITCNAQDWKTYPYTPPGSLISFSTDEGRHIGEPVEWWYTSGHFTGETSGKGYSYMLTYFYYPTSVSIFDFEGFRILNITEEATGVFYQETKPITTYSTLSTTDLDIAVNLPNGPEFWRNKVDGSSNPIPFNYELSASSATANINFELDTTKRPLILGGDGYFEQGLSNYTYYYSQTANTLTGSLTLNGFTENVTGTAWIDRQYGNFNPFTGEKYEWFSLQLDNGTDLNLWNVFTSDRTIPEDIKYISLAAYVDESTQYTTDDFEIERLEYFFTADNQKSYSKKWRLTSVSKNIDLIITANHTTSEVDITELSFRFFEGSVSVEGTIDGVDVLGIGFAELLHDYEDPDMSITSPSGGIYDTAVPISWDLNNPDDGRPITYDLEYSIDNQNTFLSIAEDIIDTSYLWSNPPISESDNVWFKITGKSIDGVLSSQVISSSSSSPTLSVQNFNPNGIKLYPNPGLNQITLEFKEQVSNVRMEVIDVSGRLLFSNTSTNTILENINISVFPQGVYFIRVYSETAEGFLRFIKK